MNDDLHHIMDVLNTLSDNKEHIVSESEELMQSFLKLLVEKCELEGYLMAVSEEPVHTISAGETYKHYGLRHYTTANQESIQ